MFGKRFTVSEFKELTHSTRIDVKVNPHTEKRFITNEASKVLGACSSKCDLKGDIVISEVINDETGAMLFVMHNPGVGAESIASF